MGVEQRHRGGMARRSPPAADTEPLIDIGQALDLLAEAVTLCGEYFVYPPVWIRDQRSPYANRAGPRCLVWPAPQGSRLGSQ
jgi:hypothetical protein